MPVEQTELFTQLSALEISLKAMAEADTQQMMLLQRVLEEVEQKPVISSVEVPICSGTVPKATNSSQPLHQQRWEMQEVRRRHELSCDRIKRF